MKQLLTTSEVIDELGGTAEVAKLLGCSLPVVSNWRRGGFPARTHLALTIALKKIHCEAPIDLWPEMIRAEFIQERIAS